LSPLGYSYGKLGETDKAMEIIAKLQQRQREESNVVVDGDLLVVWMGLGDMDKVLTHMEKAMGKRASAVNFFINFPPMKGIKNDPRAMKMIEDLRRSGSDVKS
jgi:hypothetical protein